MTIKKIDGKWVAWEEMNKTSFIGIGKTCAGAQRALRQSIGEFLCGNIKRGVK